MKCASIPFSFAKESVARRTRSIVHDRHAFTDKAIE
jgi:hypothetical protein